MSLPMKELRFGVTETIDIWLDAEAIAFGKDKAAIAREILNEWAKRKAHAFKVAHRRLATNGMQSDWLGDDTEDAGVSPADAGSSRKERR